MSANKIFKPRSSTGWLWVGALAAVLLASGLYTLINFGFLGPYMLTILLTIPLGLVFLLITVFFPAMHYEVEGDHLVLRYVPLLRYVIDISQIKSIRRQDLRISPLSSFRFPGLAIFGVPYPEVGTVKMCATAAGTGILLIETDTTKYGLTPADEEEFVAALRAQMKT